MNQSEIRSVRTRMSSENQKSEIKFLFSNQSLSDHRSFSYSEICRISILLNCGRWSARARAYLLKKMLEKPLREDAGADVLRDSPCSAHVSGKLLISPARITHRCRSLPPLIGAHEHVLESVLEREFAKSLFSLPLICM